MNKGRKKEASKVKQTTRQSNTAHPRQSLFLRNELPRVSCTGEREGGGGGGGGKRGRNKEHKTI